ncbi:hypothetical protein OSB04_031301 [Centaurea solstitialis]|uniref:Reverse transcriptase domain-containing protein n=1 Tax=Centaurea solstitialis TaxID=347529 RepID=A0AA38SUE9_9ASTR|nr:hypothetical protein OSB04_031301 [Centaurea solstitialis]
MATGLTLCNFHVFSPFSVLFRSTASKTYKSKNKSKVQKAKIKWLVEGDENSKFFHAAIKKRERRNRITGLYINGFWSDDPSRIKEYFFDSFRDKFSSAGKNRPKLFSVRFNRLSQEDAEDLERLIEEAEVWNAIKSCRKNKAPGPDGFSLCFLKKFWEILKEDLMKALHWFWESEKISMGCNSSFITLIPKTHSSDGLGDYRPISLIGMYYMLVATILAERLKKVIGKVISLTQSAFIKKRHILDGVLVADEFLIDSLENMGFGTKWRRWIEACLKSSTMSVLVNGSPTKEFGMERGLRQGDPLAPFLFLIVEENQNILFEEACEKGIFEGLKIGQEEITVSHLLYADDAIFFGKWSKSNLKILIKILECFHLLSGLKINLRKSKLYGVGVNDEIVLEWAREMGCEGGVLPFIYLGFPVGASLNKVRNWISVLDKVKKKLDSWKVKWISFGGRLTLVKLVLGSLSLYYLSLFRAPCGVLSELETIRNHFFWGTGECGKGKLVWVKWEKVISSFEDGGLNIGDLWSMNIALLGKWEVKKFWIRLSNWWNKKLEGVDSFSQLIQEDANFLKISKAGGCCGVFESWWKLRDGSSAVVSFVFCCWKLLRAAGFRGVVQQDVCDFWFGGGCEVQLVDGFLVAFQIAFLLSCGVRICFVPTMWVVSA